MKQPSNRISCGQLVVERDGLLRLLHVHSDSPVLQQVKRLRTRLKHQHAEAVLLHKRALEIKQNVLGPDHPDVGISLGNIALGLVELGEYAEAKQLHEQLDWRQDGSPPQPITFPDSKSGAH